MKQNLLILAILITSMGVLNAEVIEKTYHFSNPEISVVDGYQTIGFEKTLQTGIAGKPILPYASVSLLLPPGEIATGIEIIPGKEVFLDGMYQLYPKQYVQPLSKGASGIFAKDEGIYSQDAPYPAKIHGEFSTEFMNGFSVAFTSFTPVRYNPATGQLSYYENVTVKVISNAGQRGATALQNLNTTEPIVNRLNGIIQNPELVATYPNHLQRSDDYHLLFITPQQFEDDFQQLVDFYLPRGIKAEIATTEDIYLNMTGQDNQDKIRNFIIQEYQNHGIQHVTLGGDIEHVPYRGFYCTVQSSSLYEDDNIPSDLYYSALDGTWNDNGNNLWGEIGEDDLLPEVGVARFSFSSQADLDAMLNKTISYQESPVIGKLRDPLMLGEHLYSTPLTWGADFLDLLIGFHDDNGYETTGIPEDHDIETMYDRDQSWDKAQLMATLNYGGNSFIHHSGHSNTTYAMRMNNSDITNSNFQNLNGTTENYTLVYSHGCICGAFDASDCIAEKMINIDNFAVAVVMNSRYGWFNEGQTEGPSAHLHREFADALYYQKENHIGMAHTISRIETAPWVNAPGQWEEGALRWCFYDCTVFGDAALSIWTDEPTSITAQYENPIQAGASSLSIAVVVDVGNIENLNCVFIKDEIVYGTAQTDADGIAEIIFDEPLSGEGEATIYISGYNCQLNEFPVTIISAPNQHFSTVWTTPFNPMTFYILEAVIDATNMQPGDEIGLFDIDPNNGEEICVGAGILTEELGGGVFLEIIASMDDGSIPDHANGFTSGNNIIYKLWNEASGEIGTVQVNYPYPGYDEVYTSQGTAFAELFGFTSVTQTILLQTGWNLMSFSVEPDDRDLLGIVQPLIDLETLYKVLDENGGSIFHLPFPPPNGQWSNTIGDMQNTEGYYIKVTADAELTLEGYPVDTPMEIELTEGWNIIGYPCSEPQNALDAVQQLIDADVLYKVIDEEGGTIFHLPFPPPSGQWSNTIGNFESGEGYYIKVNENATLTLSEPAENISRLAKSHKHPGRGYFNPIWENNPFMPMHIIIQPVDLLIPG
nr:hypothetical protein [Bacteroidota bacterium]